MRYSWHRFWRCASAAQRRNPCFFDRWLLLLYIILHPFFLLGTQAHFKELFPSSAQLVNQIMTFRCGFTYNNRDALLRTRVVPTKNNRWNLFFDNRSGFHQEQIASSDNKHLPQATCPITTSEMCIFSLSIISDDTCMVVRFTAVSRMLYPKTDDSVLKFTHHENSLSIKSMMDYKQVSAIQSLFFV